MYGRLPGLLWVGETNEPSDQTVVKPAPNPRSTKTQQNPAADDFVLLPVMATHKSPATSELGWARGYDGMPVRGLHGESNRSLSCLFVVGD